MDVLLGEDETQPRNRIALICTSCRLVNGQAPPGVKTLREVGRWRCGGCGAWNGEVGEVEGMLRKLKTENQGASHQTDEEAEEDEHAGSLRTAPPRVPPDWGNAKGRPGMSEEERKEANRLAGEDEQRARNEMSYEDRREELRLLDHEVRDADSDASEGQITDEPPAKATRSRKKKT